MSPTRRLPLPSALFEPVVCPSKSCQFKGKPFLLYDGTSAAVGNPLDLAFKFFLQSGVSNSCTIFLAMLTNDPLSSSQEMIISLIKAGASPEAVRTALSGGSGSSPDKSRGRVMESLRRNLKLHSQISDSPIHS
jgi:hypothetical protein